MGGQTKVYRSHLGYRSIVLMTDSVYAPSDISFKKGTYPDPQEMTEEYISQVVDAFLESARRADEAGCTYPCSIFSYITADFALS